MRNIESLATNLYLSEKDGAYEILLAYCKKTGIKHEFIEYDPNNGFTFRQNGKWGYINFQLKQILDPIYDEKINYEYYYCFNNRYAKALVTLNGQKGVVDRDGKLIIDYGLINEFDGCNHYFIIFKEGDKYGAYNHQGKLILEPEYKDIVNFSASDIDLLTASKDNKNYLYNSKGDLLLSADNIKYCRLGKFEVIDNNITKTWQYPFGEPNFKPKKKYKCSVFKQSRMYGVKNENNEAIVPARYSNIYINDDLQVICCVYYHHNNYMFFDFQGNELFNDSLIVEYCNQWDPPLYNR